MHPPFASFIVFAVSMSSFAFAFPSAVAQGIQNAPELPVRTPAPVSQEVNERQAQVPFQVCPEALGKAKQNCPDCGGDTKVQGYCDTVRSSRARALLIHSHRIPNRIALIRSCSTDRKMVALQGDVAHFVNATPSRMRTTVLYQRPKSLSKSASKGCSVQIAVGTMVVATARISCSMDPKITVPLLDVAPIVHAVMGVAPMARLT